MLLIVPYGIETQLWIDNMNRRAGLLIVPYGIETPYPADGPDCIEAFNRTLWN